jgi:hypothetical protein
LAITAGDFAIPVASVNAVAMLPAPAKVALAPLAGAVNVTVTFATGTPDKSSTFTLSGAAKLVAMVADCPEPETTVSDAGGGVVVEGGVVVRAVGLNTEKLPAAS